MGTDIWTATRTSKSRSFSTPAQVAGVNTASREDSVALSSDGLTIYFSSDRLGGLGDRDIWYATRSDTQGTFANAANLAQANSTLIDTDVTLSADDTELFFSSSRSGVVQLWRSVRVCQ
jgi:OOP family OmpA-OmpF porin